jgi:hypothetical protein
MHSDLFPRHDEWKMRYIAVGIKLFNIHALAPFYLYSDT